MCEGFMERRKVYRAKGRRYVVGLAVLFTVLVAMVGVSVWLFVISLTVPAAILLAVGIIGIVWAAIDVLTYKLVLTEEGITLSENRVLASVKQQKVSLKYDGLCEIKHTIVLAEGAKNVPAIALFYSNGNFEFLNMKRFSTGQIKSTMSDIKCLAEAKIGREVTIFSYNKKGDIAVLYEKK